MKTTITIEDNDIRIAFTPESEIERLSITELGDEISISRSHKSIVLRRRHAPVRSISDASVRDIVTSSKAVEPAGSPGAGS